MIILLTSVIGLGLIYGLVALGVYLTFRVINFPDLSVDGSFPLGAATVATCIMHGVDPVLSTVFAVIAGMLAGCVTGCLHVYLRIMGLLAGILTMTALYSVNIRIMGRPNVALLDMATVFPSHASELWILLGIVLAIIIALMFFLASHAGLALRAVGANPLMSRTYGVHIGKMKILALSLSNGLVALAGALFAEMQGFADVSLGTGTIVIGLASIMLGEAITGVRNIKIDLIGCLIGSLLYRSAIAFALNSSIFGLQASDLNAITAGLVVLALVIPRLLGSLPKRVRIRG
ncbi:MAG: hypothetical protein ACD_45C00413G0002 [uncultured bacterium]|nr:MAG: hypothetical protein ACD_45C00413G0002 [uncultured bacterium]OGT58513.1 MAG: ABC transporter permease [Gammaproteobacteria bacterium RIFCSPHIGHO2_12_FULL_42_10]